MLYKMGTGASSGLGDRGKAYQSAATDDLFNGEDGYSLGTALRNKEAAAYILERAADGDTDFTRTGPASSSVSPERHAKMQRVARGAFLAAGRSHEAALLDLYMRECSMPTVVWAGLHYSAGPYLEGAICALPPVRDAQSLAEILAAADYSDACVSTDVWERNARVFLVALGRDEVGRALGDVCGAGRKFSMAMARAAFGAHGPLVIDIEFSSASDIPWASLVFREARLAFSERTKLAMMVDLVRLTAATAIDLRYISRKNAEESPDLKRATAILGYNTPAQAIEAKRRELTRCLELANVASEALGPCADRALALELCSAIDDRRARAMLFNAMTTGTNTAYDP